ncbi:hypothetical protein A2U01_0115937, partial [Trifolium medium]|nr:hypothetical protein [Trifolium medium]
MLGATRSVMMLRAFLLLVPPQRAREVGATRNRCWGCPVFFRVLAQRAGWCCATRRLS